uniref:Uncharacterized protein n=1 Tax=Arundo donax TaxID=35708 RepID=A0A0A8Z304_ARUDO
MLKLSLSDSQLGYCKHFLHENTFIGAVIAKATAQSLQLCFHVSCSSRATGVDRVENMTSNRVNVNPFPASQLVALKRHVAFLQAEESVIFSHTNIVPGMKAGSSLAGNDVSWFHFLSAKLLNTQILGIGVTAIFLSIQQSFWWPSV